MDITQATETLGALSQASRLEIFRYLVRRGSNGAAAGAIGKTFGLPGATLSFHLSALKNAGLVNVERQSRSLIYSPNFAHMSSLMGFLLEDCCGGMCNTPATVKPKDIKRRRK